MTATLRETSALSAGPSSRDAANRSDETQLVTFKLGAEEYGIDIMQVQEIIRLPDIVRVPKAPPFVEGVINLRHKILPVIDLARRFGTSSEQRTDASRIVVVNVRDNPVGLIVDSVCEVIRLSTGTVEPLPDVVANVDSRFLYGIGRLNDRLVLLVELAKVFSSDEVRQLESVEGSSV
ncbi:MAG: chemotaxis protein CheW [Bacillota bacterium]